MIARDAIHLLILLFTISVTIRIVPTVIATAKCSTQLKFSIISNALWKNKEIKANFIVFCFHRHNKPRSYVINV